MYRGLHRLITMCLEAEAPPDGHGLSPSLLRAVSKPTGGLVFAVFSVGTMAAFVGSVELLVRSLLVH